jgi:hypothetical protein
METGVAIMHKRPERKRKKERGRNARRVKPMA